LLLLVLPVVNWILATLLPGPAPLEKASYTFFLTQVDAGNVQQITSTSDTVEGTFKTIVSYPPDSKGRGAGRPVHHAAAVVRRRQPVRQDAAGSGGRGRGGRAVLLDVCVRVHRDDRRGWGQPGT
jgi:hypothetical protein